jgi:hypothetical protein
MAEFVSGLEGDLKAIKLNMAEHVRAADSYFEEVKQHTENLNAKLQVSVENLYGDLKVRKFDH